MLFQASLVALATSLLPSALGLAIARDTIDSSSCIVASKLIGTYNGRYSEACVKLVSIFTRSMIYF
jgi:hypothetical protein